MAATEEDVVVAGRKIEIGPGQVYYLLDEADTAQKKLKLVGVDGSIGHGVACGGAGERIRLNDINELVRENRLVRAEQYDGIPPKEQRK